MKKELDNHITELIDNGFKQLKLYRFLDTIENKEENAYNLIYNTGDKDIIYTYI